MSQLTKGMYGVEFQPQPASDLFGIHCGQMCGTQLVHNAGWYNRAGEKLGWGDLSPKDFRRIANEIDEDEFFIVLSEHDSFWNFVTHNPGIVGSMCTTEEREQAPGVEYVAEKARYIIARNQLYLVDRYGLHKGNSGEIGGLQFQFLTPEKAKELIAH